MKRRRAITVFATGITLVFLLIGAMPRLIEEGMPKLSHASLSQSESSQQQANTSTSSDAQAGLEKLVVQGRAPKTGYARSQFGDGWATVNGCSTRDIILHRDFLNVELEGECKVISGTLHDPYTAKVIIFSKDDASKVQIDHVVALSDAWQKGAQNLTSEQRVQLANDPLELLAVDGQANQQKSDGDAATWLPSNKSFRCEYVARQIAVKIKYLLWVTQAEKDAIASVLQGCPEQQLP